MSKSKPWILALILALVSAAPALAGTNAADAKPTPDASTNSAAAPAANPNLTPAAVNANVTALLGVLVMKGVLAPSEANAIRNAAPEAEFQLLVDALARKGIVNASDLAPAAPQPAPAPVAVSATVQPQAAPAQQAPPTPPAPAVVPAVAPLRVLPIDPPVRDGLKAAFTMGPVKMTPYGFLKATAVYDSSNPNGDDMPFPGLFLATPTVFSTGPTKDPEFHLKARSARIGANFEWPDISSKLTLTGKIEGDFEGNFTEVDNRDVSSIRSSQFSIRQAWVRMDYAASDRTDIYFEAGQDWTLFGSSALPNILETTALGYWYGDVYERSPQFQFGWVQKVSDSPRNFKFAPTFAIMMPSTGQIEKLGAEGLQGQLAQAEREGADSGRPEVEGRVALQFQLDPAKGVAPAQILFSGVQGRRTSLVPNTAPGYGLLPANYLTAFPNGFSASSTIWGGQFAVQLPTRYFTLVASAYRGGDLRFFFGGQVNTYATDTAGLTNIQGPFETLDGGCLTAAGCAVLGTNGAGQVVVAPQKPIHAFGGFINLGLPLSRWFNANPKGHNAGWQLYLHAGKDQVYASDLKNPGFTANANSLSPLPLRMGKLAAATLYYKVNPFVTFGLEQSIYATRLITTVPGLSYVIAGQPSNEWQDHRTEFGPIFTF